MSIETNTVIRPYFVLTITTYTADVNFYHSTIAEDESLDPISTKLLQVSCKLIPLYSRVKCTLNKRRVVNTSGYRDKRHMLRNQLS